MQSKMTSKITIGTVKRNAEVAKKTIIELKNELNVVNAEYNTICVKQLLEENTRLLLAVEDAKKKLIELELRNGTRQIPLQNQILSKSILTNRKTTEVNISETIKAASDTKIVNIKGNVPKKEKTKDFKENIDIPIDVGRLDLRIARVEDVQKHPDADTLYILKVNCGEEKLRTVCSGLVKHVPMDELKEKLVLLLCNLKPVKMRGIMSEAMIMCASTADLVEVLIPPKDSLPGELVECEGYIRKPDTIMNPKKKIFETVCPDLHTNDRLEACYKTSPFCVSGKGRIIAKTLKNVAVK